MKHDFEYYRQIITSMAENPSVVTVNEISDMESASVEERVKLALFLLSELGEFWESMRIGKHTRESYVLFDALIGEIMDSKILTYEDYHYIASNGSLFMVGCALYNASYPLDLLVDYNYLQDDGSGSEDLGLLGFPTFASLLEATREKRLSEVASFLRDRISGSESLPDEMVLNIAGVAFSRE
jgi:hypothetical protein